MSATKARRSRALRLLAVLALGLLTGCSGEAQAESPSAWTWPFPPQAPAACRTVARPFSVENPWDHAHEAIDLACPSGTPILAVAAGSVQAVEQVDVAGELRYRLALVLDGQPLRVEYLNLRRVVVQEGDHLEAGAAIGESATGLHLAAWSDEAGRYLDPSELLPAPGQE